MNFNIIGAGRLGKNIALALCSNNLGTLGSICNQTLESAKKSCKQLGFGTAVETVQELPPAELIWITCNDDSISSVVKQLNSLKPGTLIIHTSGVLSSSIFSCLKEQGCSIASMHPMKSFSSNYLDSDAFNEVDCIIEGDQAACIWLKKTFEALHAHVLAINPKSKPAYHAAACMVANYLVTLSSYSEELLVQSGLTHEQTQRIISNLARGVVYNMEQSQSCAQALTGPLSRGDTLTITKHLQAIKNPLAKKLYKIAGLATVPLTQLTKEKKSASNQY